jgi:hypothetical protein
MAKDPAEFTQQNTQRAMQAATFGMNWFREVAEQNLNQSAIALDALLTVARKLAQEVGSQTSVIWLFMTIQSLLQKRRLQTRLIWAIN